MSDAVINLLQQAVVHHQQGRLVDAERIYRQVLASAPAQPDAHNLLGVIAHQTGRLDDATELIARAVSLNPADANFRFNLANVLHAKGDYRKSAAEFDRLLSLRPDHAAAANGLGLALRSLGDADAAQSAFERAVRIDSKFWEAIFNLGCAYEQSGRTELAIDCYDRALVMQPRSALALSNRGHAKLQLKRFADAEMDLRRAVEIEPNAAIAHVNLGMVLLAQEKTVEAINHFQRAIVLTPDMPEAFNDLGLALSHLKEFDEAAKACEGALALRPNYVDAMVNLGRALREQGRTSDAMDCFRRAVKIDPDEQSALGNMLFTMILLPEYDMAAIYQANRDFWRRQSGEWSGKKTFRNAAMPQKRLRIGYVSADFRRHAAAYFMEPILAHHDRSQFEVYCYYNHVREDQYTARFKDHASAWRNIAQATDIQVSTLLEQDGIDILVDLSGHTAGGRLQVFAARPAPVQITYLGYPATSGLDAMDYRLTDSHADPSGVSDSYYTEELARLPDSLWCYSPPPDLPDVAKSPALTNRYPTFGSFNHVNKIGPDVVALWSKLLKAIPDSKLLITSVPAGLARRRMEGLFAGCDIDLSRLQLVGAVSNTEFLKLYHRVDVALDSFPCNGATSTCESLWMGVPVISLIGKTFAGRAGLSLLSAAGCRDWVAKSEQEYVAIARHLAADLDALSATRAALRDRVRISALGDAGKFTCALESVYREKWSQWCARQGDTPPMQGRQK